jgi:SsrA-binding protein
MKIYNRKFNRNYQKLESLEAGIVLNGSEVKAVRAGRIRLEDAFVKILGSELYLINADVSIYEYARPQGYDSRRTRKLLLHKKEILRLKTKLNSGSNLTIAPVSCYNKRSIIKLEIALSKGRREIEKKKLDKRRDIELEQRREMKEYLKK